MRKHLPIWGFVLAVVLVLGAWVGSVAGSDFGIELLGYDIKTDGVNAWIVAYLEIKNTTRFVASEVTVYSRHFDGESWLGWLHKGIAEDAEPGEVRQIRWTYSTRANPEGYILLPHRADMKVEVKVRWTVFGVFRHKASRVISL